MPVTKHPDRLSGGTPAGLKPGALAYALPYEGTHVCVFYDRIARNYTHSLVPTVLGHVLAHEITHILQGISRHSDHGIMKAKWTSGDFAAMACKPLEFEPRDIDLIYHGLAARTARPLVAQNTAPGTVAAQ